MGERRTDASVGCIAFNGRLQAEVSHRLAGRGELPAGMILRTGTAELVYLFAFQRFPFGLVSLVNIVH